jgi:hypothetical protein
MIISAEVNPVFANGIGQVNVCFPVGGIRSRCIDGYCIPPNCSGYGPCDTMVAPVDGDNTLIGRHRELTSCRSRDPSFETVKGAVKMFDGSIAESELIEIRL